MRKIIVASIIFGLIGAMVGFVIGIDQTMDRCIDLGLRVLDIEISDKDVLKQILLKNGFKLPGAYA